MKGAERNLAWSWALAVMVAGAGACCACAEVGVDRAPVELTARTWPGPVLVPVEGVELCETDTKNCTRSDAAGRATLYLPFDEEVSVTAVKAGLQSELNPLVVPPDGARFELALASEQRLQEQFSKVGSVYPMVDTGMLVLVTVPYCRGVTITVVGSMSRGKIVYLDDDFDWSLDLEATSSAGIAVAVGLGAGDYRVELGGTASHCTVLAGWPTPVENSVRLPVRAGFVSEAHVTCDCR